jgi:hypothetical protein
MKTKYIKVKKKTREGRRSEMKIGSSCRVAFSFHQATGNQGREMAKYNVSESSTLLLSS